MSPKTINLTLTTENVTLNRDSLLLWINHSIYLITLTQIVLTNERKFFYVKTSKIDLDYYNVT